MTEATRKKLVYATLPIALVWAWSNIGSNSDQGLPSDDQYVTVQPLAPTSGVAGSGQFIDVSAERHKHWGSDPFRSRHVHRPTTVSKRAGLSLILSGIIYSQTKPLAFINKRTVAVGDKVGEATVVAIDQTTVTLEHQGRTITLKVDKG